MANYIYLDKENEEFYIDHFTEEGPFNSCKIIPGRFPINGHYIITFVFMGRTVCDIAHTLEEAKLRAYEKAKEIGKSIAKQYNGKFIDLTLGCPLLNQLEKSAQSQPMCTGTGTGTGIAVDNGK